MKLYEQKEWTFSGVDFTKLKEDASAQRAERSEHDAMEGQYLSAHEKFGLAQEDFTAGGSLTKSKGGSL